MSLSPSSIYTRKHVSMRVHTRAHTLLLLSPFPLPAGDTALRQSCFSLTTEEREACSLSPGRKSWSQIPILLCSCAQGTGVGDTGAMHSPGPRPGAHAPLQKGHMPWALKTASPSMPLLGALRRLETLSHSCWRGGTVRRGVMDSTRGTVCN